MDLWAGVLLAIAGPGSLQSDREAPVMDALAGFAEAVDSVRAAWDIPGLAVAIVKDGEVVFAQGFGLRDIEGGEPVTTDTVFGLGSSTKSFTALALALLAADGALDLDAPLVEAVPAFRLHDERAGAQTTARDLLAHRAGIPGRYDMLWLLTPIDRAELFARLRFLPLDDSQRGSFHYSNVGYAVAGVVLERVSGVSWETFLRERIFEPLGMDRTGFVNGNAPPGDDWARAYRKDGRTHTPVPFAGTVAFERATLIGPAGSVRSTAADTARWVHFLLAGGRTAHGELATATTVEELFAPAVEITDPGYRMLTQGEAYGLGWVVGEHRGHRVLSHGGNIEAYSSLVSLLPSIDAGIVVLSNTMNMAGYEISRDAYDRLLGLDPPEDEELRTFFAMLQRGRAAAASPPDSEPDARAAHDPEECAGTYTNPAFGRATVRARPSALELTFATGVRAKLHRTSDDGFKATTSEVYLPTFELRFWSATSGRVGGFDLVLQPDSPAIVFTREP